MKLFRAIDILWFLSLLLLLLIIDKSPEANELPYMTADPEEISGKSYDYIVVGGGTTGCPMAATLSEEFSVLVIERGRSPYGNPLIEQQIYYGYPLTQTDKYTSPAHDFTSRDGVKNTRGRILGGSSAINGGFYSRASDDFVKKVGWDQELVEEAYKWVESKVVFKPELSRWQSVVQFGFLEAGVVPYNGYSLEHIQGTKIGGSIFDPDGKRRTSADLLRAGNPRKITVLLNTTVKSIIFDGDKNKTSVRGVKLVKSVGSSDEIYEAYLKQDKKSNSSGEIILSAGALGSTQILLLSGLGPEKHLNKFNIPLVANLKAVGSGMRDNPGIAILADMTPKNFQPEPPQVAAIAENFKFIIESGIIPVNKSTTRMPIAAKIAFPESKGRLKLTSTDPRQNPSVKFNYLKKKKDLEECVEMVLLLQHVARSEAVSFYLGSQPQNKLLTRVGELKDFCKQNVRTYYHFHGGCVVGSVIDEDYRVYGVKGLRIVDGSTLVDSPGTNPMATLMMLGRYRGIKMLRERRLKERRS